MDDLGMNHDVARDQQRAALALVAANYEATDEGIADLITDLMHLADRVGSVAPGDDFDGWYVWRWAQKHYEGEAPDEDTRNLQKACALVRKHLPTAIALNLETSDQGHYGFVVQGIVDKDGNDLQYDPVPGPDEVYLSDELVDYLQDLRWNNAVGETRQGYATINLIPQAGK